MKRSTRCKGLKRYAMRCLVQTAHPTGLCPKHRHQDEMFRLMEDARAGVRPVNRQIRAQGKLT